jgi:hypothetical protein
MWRIVLRPFMRHHTFQARPLALASAPCDGGGPLASTRPKADATGRHLDSILPPAPTQTSAPATGQAQRHPARERPRRHWSCGSADPAERAPRGFDLDEFSFYSLIP